MAEIAPLTNPMTILRSLLLLAVVMIANTARAEVAVLLHGYMGSPNSWEKSGVNRVLELTGWGRGGVIIPDLGEFIEGPAPYSDNVTFLVDLPWMLPLEEQAQYFALAMDAVNQMRPNEPITLVGHSVGGVVQRYWLVKGGNENIRRLITIASPHMGTQRAIDALRLTNPTIYPVDKVRNYFGGKLYNTVRRSRELVKDLIPPQKSRRPNALSWLNLQPHPDIEYISIIREDRFGLDRDWIVSADSQDMNTVPVLAGRSTTYSVPAKHFLTRGDGKMLAAIIMPGGDPQDAISPTQLPPHAPAGRLAPASSIHTAPATTDSWPPPKVPSQRPAPDNLAN